MPYTVQRDGEELRLVLRGTLELEEVMDSIESLAAADADGSSQYFIADLSALERLDLEVEDYHRLASAARIHFTREPHYRFAVVGSSDLVARLVADYLEVNDLVVAPREAPPRLLQFFETVEAARQWARPSPTPA